MGKRRTVYSDLLSTTLARKLDIGPYIPKQTVRALLKAKGLLSVQQIKDMSFAQQWKELEKCTAGGNTIITLFKHYCHSPELLLRLIDERGFKLCEEIFGKVYPSGASAYANFQVDQDPYDEDPYFRFSPNKSAATKGSPLPATSKPKKTTSPNESEEHFGFEAINVDVMDTPFKQSGRKRKPVDDQAIDATPAKKFHAAFTQEGRLESAKKQKALMNGVRATIASLSKGIEVTQEAESGDDQASEFDVDNDTIDQEGDEGFVGVEDDSEASILSNAPVVNNFVTREELDHFRTEILAAVRQMFAIKTRKPIRRNRTLVR